MKKSNDAVARIRELAAQHKGAAEIARAIGTTIHSVQRWAQIEKIALPSHSQSARRMGRERWTEAQVATLLRLRDGDGLLFSVIDEHLGKRPGASRQKYDYVKSASGSPRAVDTVTSSRVPDRQLADRTARAALSHNNLTAALFGDPLPGRSALDKRRELTTPPAGRPARLEA